MSPAELKALAKRLEKILGGVEVSPEQKQATVAALVRTIQDPKSSAAQVIKAAGVFVDIDRANLELLKFVRDEVAPPDDETPSG